MRRARGILRDLRLSRFQPVAEKVLLGARCGAPLAAIEVFRDRWGIPHIRAETPEAEAHARIGWFRAVANIQHAFAIQSFVAEIAQAIGKDPKDYLLDLIGPGFTLITPGPTLGSPDFYNRLFTMHGIIMVWFFLIPSIPSTLGNFVVPLMIGARDLAFPRLNLTSWYLFMAGGLTTL